MSNKYDEMLKALTGYTVSQESVAQEAANPYPNSMVGDELEVLDQYEAHMESVQAAQEAVVENVFELQAVALESAGLSGLNEIASYEGALSFEAIGNSIKRGAYNVKIQAKKMIAKVWAIIKSIFTFFGGADGRLKSYAKLIKKWRKKLSAIKPRDKKDGESRELEIRIWDKLAGQVKTFVTEVGIEAIKKANTAVKGANVKSELTSFVTQIGAVTACITDIVKGNSQNGDELLGNLKSDDTFKTAAELEKFEEAYSETLADRDNINDKIKEITDDLKDVDKETMSITAAQSKLMSWAIKVEQECAQDVKFKKEYDKLIKSWDKAFDTSKLDMSKGTDQNRQIAAVSRILGKISGLLVDSRKYLQGYYKAIVSNIQGLTADMAKVTAKGTSVTAA